MHRVRHLATRFFEVLGARPLSPAEQSTVDRWLEPAERPLFWGQPPEDQRHAFDAAIAVEATATGRTDLVRAALLHDVGKRHSALGVTGRVFASLLRLARMPARGRIAAYLDHGALGAEELQQAGSEPIVVLFARHHHRAKAPAGADTADWAVLRRADGE